MERFARQTLAKKQGFLKILDNIDPHEFVTEYLGNTPKYSSLTKFRVREERFVAKVDFLLQDCINEQFPGTITNQINASSLGSLVQVQQG